MALINLFYRDDHGNRIRERLDAGLREPGFVHPSLAIGPSKPTVFLARCQATDFVPSSTFLPRMEIFAAEMPQTPLSGVK
jgi:hypothetical protein